MNVLTNEQLNDLCLTLKNYDAYYWYQCVDFLNDIYYLGCRSEELFDISRWYRYNESTVAFMPFKGNIERVVFAGYLSEKFLYAIDNQVKPYSGLTLRQLMFQVNRVNPYGQIYVQSKPMDAYIFRYNRVKQMVDAGIDYGEIREFFGWTTNAMINQYYSAQLYYI